MSHCFNTYCDSLEWQKQSSYLPRSSFSIPAIVKTVSQRWLKSCVSLSLVISSDIFFTSVEEKNTAPYKFSLCKPNLRKTLLKHHRNNQNVSAVEA